jgi:LPS-assembly lipoprotein
MKPPRSLTQLVAPMMPHLAEECWQAACPAGPRRRSILARRDEALLKDDSLVLPVQINGKKRAFAASCQVKPLYATNSDTAAALPRSISPRPTIASSSKSATISSSWRAGAPGEPVNPEYDVDFNVTTRYIGVLLDLDTDLPRAGRVEVRADFTLTRHGTGEILKTGKRRAVALVDYPNQEFAKIRATRDAENRAARELAELMRADIASWLGR